MVVVVLHALGRPQQRLELPEGATVATLRTQAAAAAGFDVARTRLVSAGRALLDSDGSLALPPSAAVLALAAPRDEPLAPAGGAGGGAGGAAGRREEEEDDFAGLTLDAAGCGPVTLRAARALHRAGASEALLALLLGVPTRRWAALAAWGMAMRLAVRHDLGPVALTLTGFALIAGNLGTRRAGELSAYSVFNEGFQEIPGTLNAGALDEQMRQGQLG